MMDKSVSVAVQVPVFTANTMRRCKRCAVLDDDDGNVMYSRVRHIFNGLPCKVNCGPLTNE